MSEEQQQQETQQPTEDKLSADELRTAEAIKVWSQSTKQDEPVTEPKVEGDAKPPEEQAAPDEPGEEPTATDLSGKIAELARRDRELQAIQRQLRAEAAKVREAEALMQEMKTDPLGVLLKSGIDISAVLDSISGKGESSKPQTDPRVEQLTKEVEALKAHTQKSSRDQIYNRELAKIHGLISKDPEQFEAVIDRVQEGSLDDIFTALNAMYQQTGKMPDEDDYAEAARVVEEVYRQEETERIKRLAASKRHAGKLSLGEGSTPKAESDSAKAAKPKAPARTINSELTREPPLRKQKMTEEERTAAAIELAKQLALT